MLRPASPPGAAPRLGPLGWKVTAGGHASRRSSTNQLTANLHRNKTTGEVLGSVRAYPLAFEGVARRLEQATELPRRTVTELRHLVESTPLRLPLGEDPEPAAAAAEEVLDLLASYVTGRDLGEGWSYRQLPVP